MLVYGVAAEWLGNIAAITGAFLAGLMFGRTPEKERLQAGMNALAYGLFVPVFFVNIGLEVDIRQIQSDEFFLLIAITFVAIFGKLLGAGWGARLAGFNWLESLQLGAGMVSRGEVGLILASVAISNNIMSMGVFTDIVFVVLITTLVTPPMLRYMFRLTQPGAGAVMQPASRKEME
jgi:Kef-type K+ transport system membrane component KefB